LTSTVYEGQFSLPSETKQRRRSDRNGTLRVLAVGDCNTCGITVPPAGNTILDKFCRQLEYHGLSTTRQNLGYGMATTREGVERMRRDAEPADIVLINFGLVDTWITTIPTFYVPYYPETLLRKRLRKLLKFVKRRLRSPWLSPVVPTGHVVAIDEYTENLSKMIAIAQAKNPLVHILLWGSPPVRHDSIRNENLSRYNRRLEDLAMENHASYVSTAPLVGSLNAQQAYVDDVHLSEASTTAIANELALVYQSQPLAATG